MGIHNTPVDLRTAEPRDTSGCGGIQDLFAPSPQWAEVGPCACEVHGCFSSIGHSFSDANPPSSRRHL